LDTILLEKPIQALNKEGLLLVRPHMEQIVENRLRSIWKGAYGTEKDY
jgi:hypothetical protein